MLSSYYSTVVTGHPNCENCVPTNFVRISCPIIFLPTTLCFEGSSLAFEYLFFYNNLAILAENKIGIFVVSTYNTDYVLVKEENYNNALALLEKEGYVIV